MDLDLTSPSRARSRRRGVVAAALIAAGMSAGAIGGFAGVAAADPGFGVTPASTHAGGSVTVSGSCDPDTSGYAISDGFVHTEDFAGVPAVSFSTDGDGKFVVAATIAPTTAAGTYSVSVRCGGGLLGMTASYDVLEWVVVAPPTVPTPPKPPVKVAPATPVHATPHYTG
jgi:hypothetical protein